MQHFLVAYDMCSCIKQVIKDSFLPVIYILKLGMLGRGFNLVVVL
jgi:hypothetical protein